MADNVKYTGRPTWPVASCTSAHNAGDLVYEGGRPGVAVETNAAAEPNTLIHHGIVKLVVPASLAVGQKIYASTSSYTAGQTIQAIGTLTAGTKTSAPDNHRSAAVTSVLNTTSSNVLVGTLMTASTTEGASVVADVELTAS